jgi:hypothetical protein
MSIKDIKKKCIALNIKAPTNQVLIEILSQMQGYSKREDLLEKEYYKVVGKTAARSPYSHFGRLCLKLLEFDLLQEKNSTEGFRIALNKKVWEQDVEIIEDIIQYAEIIQEEMRADTQISTIVSRVKKLYAEDASMDISHSNVEPIVAFFVTEKDPDIQDGSFVRFKHTKRRPDQIHRSHTSPKISPKEESENLSLFSSLPESENIPIKDDVNLWPGAVMKFFKDNEFRASFHPSGEIIIMISLAQNRTQQVYISRKSNALLRIETISGPVEEVSANLVQIFKRNDKISPIKIAIMDRNGTNFVGCISGAHITSQNLSSMKELVLETARLGDELENTFWNQDLY